MRKLSIIALGAFLASLALAALNPHCVAGVERRGASVALTAAPSQAGDADHHPSEHPKKERCIAGSDLTVGNMAALRAVPAPKLKMLAVLWPAPLDSGIAPLTTGAKPFSGVAARASPAHASGFSRTDRLLI